MARDFTRARARRAVETRDCHRRPGVARRGRSEADDDALLAGGNGDREAPVGRAAGRERYALRRLGPPAGEREGLEDGGERNRGCCRDLVAQGLVAGFEQAAARRQARAVEALGRPRRGPPRRPEGRDTGRQEVALEAASAEPRLPLLGDDEGGVERGETLQPAELHESRKLEGEEPEDQCGENPADRPARGGEREEVSGAGRRQVRDEEGRGAEQAVGELDVAHGGVRALPERPRDGMAEENEESGAAGERQDPASPLRLPAPATATAGERERERGETRLEAAPGHGDEAAERLEVLPVVDAGRERVGVADELALGARRQPQHGARAESQGERQRGCAETRAARLEQQPGDEEDRAGDRVEEDRRPGEARARRQPPGRRLVAPALGGEQRPRREAERAQLGQAPAPVGGEEEVGREDVRRPSHRSRHRAEPPPAPEESARAGRRERDRLRQLQRERERRAGEHRGLDQVVRQPGVIEEARIPEPAVAPGQPAAEEDAVAEEVVELDGGVEVGDGVGAERQAGERERRDRGGDRGRHQESGDPRAATRHRRVPRSLAGTRRGSRLTRHAGRHRAQASRGDVPLGVRCLTVL